VLGRADEVDLAAVAAPRELTLQQAAVHQLLLAAAFQIAHDDLRLLRGQPVRLALQFRNLLPLGVCLGLQPFEIRAHLRQFRVGLQAVVRDAIA
jgi:hypothetical protein